MFYIMVAYVTIAIFVSIFFVSKPQDVGLEIKDENLPEREHNELKETELSEIPNQSLESERIGQ